jgi:hypothetical protein
VLDPWLYYPDPAAHATYANADAGLVIDADAGEHRARRCTVLARYSSATAGIHGGSPRSTTAAKHYGARGAGAAEASVVWADNVETAGGTLFSSSPLPPAALLEVAKAAGVHLYLDTAAANGTACNGNGADAAGAGLLLRGGASADGSEHQVLLPFPATVTDEQGVAVCSHCTSFTAKLVAGNVQLFYVIPAPAPVG